MALSVSGRADAGKEGASFLELPVGARPAALGGAYAPLAADAYAPAWNPAGLGFVHAPQVAVSHLAYLEAVSYENLSFALPLYSLGGLGASLQYLNPGRLTGRDAAGAPTGDFSGYYGAAGLSYGRAFLGRLALGVTGKTVGASIDGVSARAYAADLGVMLKAGEATTVSGVAANVGSRLKFLSQGDELSSTIRAGAAHRFGKVLEVAAEGVFGRSGSPRLHAGAEWRLYDGFALRAGYQTEALRELSHLAGMSAGLGLRWSRLGVDYAWVPMGDLGMAHAFSVNLSFGGAP